MSKSSDPQPEGSTTELTADRPIDSRHQDRLGRATFAHHLATAIARWKESDSLVIALYGEWGIGKSSIKNLALEQLRAAGEETPDIVEFNPWHWTGHEDLSAAFFREVLAVLEGVKGSKNAHAVARTLRRYAAYLGLLNVFLGGPKGFIALALTVFGALSIAPPFFLAEEHALTFGKALGAAALAIAAFIFWGQQVLEKLAVWIDFAGPGPASLADRKKAVVTALRNYKRTVLVVIDDVDRLTANEIQAVFQLIKANADFPRFVYLVMFQRNIVERALADLTKESGTAFLEKIVQVGFDVPQARQDEIDQILFEGLERVLGTADSERINQTHWGNIYFGSLRRYFQDLRDVKRYLATLEFHLNLLRTNGTLDINAVDLIAIEALRLFEPDFYRKVRGSKALLTSSRSPDASDKARVAEDIKAIFADLPADRSKTLTQVARELFPTIGFAFGGSFFSPEFRSEWNRDLRICAPDFFDRYFQLGLSKGEISQHEVEMLLAASSDAKAFTRELERLADESRLEAALDRLDTNKERIQSEHAVSALTALLDIGERLPEAKPGAFLGPEWTIQRIAYQVLKREPDADRIKKLETILKGARGLRMPIMFIGVNSNPQDRQKNPENILIPDGELPKVQAICLEKINNAALEGRLLDQRDLAYALFRWRDWAGESDPRQWVEKVTGSPEGALAFLRAFLHKGTSRTVGDHVARINYYIKYSDLEPFADLNALEAQIGKLSEVRLSELDGRVVEEFRKAIARKRAGKAEGIFGWDT